MALDGAEGNDMDASLHSSDRFRLADDAVDALLDGTADVHSLPPAYAPLAGLLAAASAPATPSERTAEPEAIRAIFDAARRTPVHVPRVERSKRGLVAARAAVVAVIASLSLGGGVALAAGGNLPAPLQGAAHSVLGSVGITVPDNKPPTTAVVPPTTAVVTPPSSSGNTPAHATPTTGTGNGIGTGSGATEPGTPNGTPDETGRPADPGANGLAVCTEASQGTCAEHRPDASGVPGQPQGGGNAGGQSGEHPDPPEKPSKPDTPATSVTPPTGPPSTKKPAAVPRSTVPASPPTTEKVKDEGNGQGKDK